METHLKPIFTVQHSSSCHYVVHTRDHIMCPWEIARWPLTDSSHLRSHHMLLKTRSYWKLSSRFILYPHSYVGSKKSIFLIKIIYHWWMFLLGISNIAVSVISYISKVFYNYYVWRYIQNNSILYIKPFLCVEKLILYQIHKTLTSCHRQKLYYFQRVQYYWSHIILPSNE